LRMCVTEPQVPYCLFRYVAFAHVTAVPVPVIVRGGSSRRFVLVLVRLVL